MGEGSSGVVACGWQIPSHTPRWANSDWPCMQVMVLGALAWCLSTPHGAPWGLEPQAPSGFSKSSCMNGLQDVVGISMHCAGALRAVLGLLPTLSHRCQLLSSLPPPAELTAGASASTPTETSPCPSLRCLPIGSIYLIDTYLYIFAKFFPKLQSIFFHVSLFHAFFFSLEMERFFNRNIQSVFFFLNFSIHSMHIILGFFPPLLILFSWEKKDSSSLRIKVLGCRFTGLCM